MSVFRLVALSLALALAVTATPALAGHIYIGEYVEGAAGKTPSEFDKAIEIVNPNPTIASLTGVSLVIYADGSFTPTATIALSGTIPGYGVYVVAHPSAHVDILSVANLTDVALSFLDGNDVVVLVQLPTNYLDVIGQIGYDPPEGCWCYPWPGCTCDDPLSTLDAVLRRVGDYQGGIVIPSDPFGIDPDQWRGYPADDFSGLGYPGFYPDPIFSDDFETGNWSAWSGVVDQ